MQVIIYIAKSSFVTSS